ncbi:MAG: hydrogenase [Candidatus Eremiobacter antarcticus]|nr:nickel-dependent hydrogenase large subunit [Candidatus Eremiobacteraeota bacterium]MBC5808765.1 nickel-dependent hydrogenase large subunit [Candidatus Eremiobacteraeota bacterium]PZR61737.1 MAG: hydrogenase [Candidatus Eremiobacter sp. RRmetagenome_bin22]
MAIKDLPAASTTTASDRLVEMSWDPITRIVGSLGIYTKIDFKERRVAECYSTSAVFRGYSIFMKGKDPRDAHFITSRICGICGDNHATCSVYAQNMAYGVAPPALGEWIINLGEAAEFMFDHNIFQENLVGVDFCEKMIKETNPGVWQKAEKAEAPNAAAHGYRTIGDIMKSLNPFEGEFYREALVVSRYTREMFCLMEGRHVHPSTLYAGGVGTVATVQLFTDYMARLMRYVEFMKRVVPLHEDLFNFIYQAMPGYEHVGERRILLGCWGSFNDPDHCDFDYRKMSEWGRKMFVTPGVIVDGKLVTNDLVKINLGIRILLGHSYYDDWDGRETFVSEDPLGNPVDRRHPWNMHTLPQPQKRDFKSNYSWVMSPRWYDGKDYLALDTGGGPLARLWSTALSGLVDIGYVRATGNSVVINLPKTALKPGVTFEWKIPKYSNTIERNRARTFFQAYAAACALHFLDKALECIRAGHTKTWEPFTVPKDAIGCGFTEAVRGVLSHHMVIRDGKIANYHPWPPTPWNANPRDIYGTPGPYEDAVQNTPIFEENGPENFKGIDIMRSVRSFDPCLPCGVHMYVGDGKTIDVVHSPMVFPDAPG